MSISGYSYRISSCQSRIDRMRAQIKQIEDSITEEQREMEEYEKEKTKSEKTKINLEKEISELKEIPIAPIQEKINNLQATNQKIRDNQRPRLTADRTAQGGIFKGSDDMRAKDQEKSICSSLLKCRSRV